MPTYEYACTNADCGNRFDLVQSFSDPAATECPVCGQAVRKVYGAVGVVFKGSGFYRNDSRDGARTGAKAESGSTSADSASAPSATPDSSSAAAKSADKSAAKPASPAPTPAATPAKPAASTPA
jgi:putative FmdB family regulatory protein